MTTANPLTKILAQGSNLLARLPYIMCKLPSNSEDLLQAAMPVLQKSREASEVGDAFGMVMFLQSIEQLCWEFESTEEVRELILSFIEPLEGLVYVHKTLSKVKVGMRAYNRSTRNPEVGPILAVEDLPMCKIGVQISEAQKVISVPGYQLYVESPYHYQVRLLQEKVMEMHTLILGATSTDAQYADEVTLKRCLIPGMIPEKHASF
jgi:hypothetical protein